MNRQSVNHQIRQSYNHAIILSSNYAVMKLYNYATIQWFICVIIQRYNYAILQFCNYAIMLLYKYATIEIPSFTVDVSPISVFTNWQGMENISEFQISEMFAPNNLSKLEILFKII